tara:strand:- start:3765 stop:4199 length:435 start_codon:yes stop_codon:yes gene_type:complete
MNPIQQKIQEAKNILTARRGSGRTQQMLDEIIEYTKENTDKKIIVLAQDQHIANWVLEKMVEKVSALTPIKLGASQSMELNGNLIMFKSWNFRDHTSYKYQKWDNEFHDNSISDNYLEEHIAFMENEIAEPVGRTRTMSGHIKF